MKAYTYRMKNAEKPCYRRKAHTLWATPVGMGVDSVRAQPGYPGQNPSKRSTGYY